MHTFDKAFKEEDIVVISFPDANIYKKLDGKIMKHLIVPNYEWMEIDKEELKKLKIMSFELWRDRFGNEPKDL